MNNAALSTVSVEREEPRQQPAWHSAPEVDWMPSLWDKLLADCSDWNRQHLHLLIWDDVGVEVVWVPGRACSFCLSGQRGRRKDLFRNICSRKLSQISSFYRSGSSAALGNCVGMCIRQPSSLRRAPVRISCPLDMNISVSMPPINKHIDPMFDCLDNLCEFQHNSSHSGFKDVRVGALSCLTARFSEHSQCCSREACCRGSSRVSTQILDDLYDILQFDPAGGLTQISSYAVFSQMLNYIKDACLKRKTRQRVEFLTFTCLQGQTTKVCRSCQHL